MYIKDGLFYNLLLYQRLNNKLALERKSHQTRHATVSTRPVALLSLPHHSYHVKRLRGDFTSPPALRLCHSAFLLPWLNHFEWAREVNELWWLCYPCIAVLIPRIIQCSCGHLQLRFYNHFIICAARCCVVYRLSICFQYRIIVKYPFLGQSGRLFAPAIEGREEGICAESCFRVCFFR